MPPLNQGTDRRPTLIGVFISSHISTIAKGFATARTKFIDKCCPRSEDLSNDDLRTNINHTTGEDVVDEVEMNVGSPKHAHGEPLHEMNPVSLIAGHDVVP